MPVSRRRLVSILVPIILIILAGIAGASIMFFVQFNKNTLAEDINGVWVNEAEACPPNTVKVSDGTSIEDMGFCIQNFNLKDGGDIGQYEGPSGCVRDTQDMKVKFNLRSKSWNVQNSNYQAFCKNIDSDVGINIIGGCAAQETAVNFNIESLCCQNVGCTNKNDGNNYDEGHCFDNGSCSPVLMCNEQYRYSDIGWDSYGLVPCYLIVRSASNIKKCIQSIQRR